MEYPYLNIDDIDNYEKNYNPEIAKLLIDRIETYNDTSIEVKNILLDEINFREKLAKSELKNFGQVYNSLYLQSHQRFFLLPIKVILENNEKFWIIPQLFVFSNLFAFIKYEVPIVNGDMEIPKENAMDKCLKEIKMIDGKNVKEFKEFNELTRYFIEYLTMEIKLKKITKIQEFRNILLIEYDNMPPSLKNLNNKIKEDIFFILSAPVPNREIVSYKDEAKIFLKDSPMEEKIFYLY